MSVFEVGAVVAIENLRRAPRKSTVVKVYKNGNIVLDGSTKQYRVSGDIAYETGPYRYGRPVVRLWTAEHDAELAQKIISDRWFRAIAEIGSKADAVTEDQVATIEALLAAFKTDGETS